VRKDIDQKVDAFATRGYRALGVSKTDSQGNWRYVGLIALYDPPREDSAETIKTAKSMGVHVKMVTGDHIAIAKEISSEMGMGTNIVPASAILDKSDREAARVVETADGFAQVFPEDKYLIVDKLQKADHFVGMTGDGVNDAPALKKADAGIAVSGATDAARAAADLVLLAPGLSVIVEAIKGARKTFETIRVILFMTASIVIFNFYPVTALMIILLAFLNDIPILTIAYDNAKVDEHPVRWNMPEVLTLATVLGILGVASSFGIFYIAEEYLHFTASVVQTFIFLKLVIAGHLTIFITRTDKHFWQKPYPSLLFFSATFSTKIIGTLFAVFGWLLVPIGWKYSLLIWGYALAWFVVNDFVKVWVYKFLRKDRMIA
jgi:H+-transporting ATPase